MRSPFMFGKIVAGEKFIDREEEQKQLSHNIASHINTVLISPRRWGKSSLVMCVAEALERRNPRVRFCFLDLFNVRSEEEFYAQLAKEVLRVSFSKWEERVESAKRFFKRLTPKFSVGVDPLHDFSVSFDWEELRKSFGEILDLPEEISREKEIQVVVCLDEFQNIGYFDEPLGFQKRLRAQWQHHELATYCLYGSKRHLMTELFEQKSMPLYKFGDILFLEKIREEHWVPFITEGFSKTGKRINEGLASRIAQDMECHPYFVQQLAYAVWTATTRNCTTREYDAAVDSLLTQHAFLFQRQVDALTNPQANFLKALCDNVAQLSAADTVQKYQLGTSGNVNRIKTALVNKEVLDITSQKIEFIDPLFKLWFRTVYMRL